MARPPSSHVPSTLVPYPPLSRSSSPNGSFWPHDTALCAAGIARGGDRDAALRLLCGMFETASHFEMRLPELFCGFPRKHGNTPVSYPVACLPQAWAAGAGFMLLQACLGVERSEEHTSELQSLMRISYAVFCLKKQKIQTK